MLRYHVWAQLYKSSTCKYVVKVKSFPLKPQIHEESVNGMWFSDQNGN